MRWLLRTADSAQVELLAKELQGDTTLHLRDLQLASTLARLLVSRRVVDIEAARQFLTPSIDQQHSP